MINTNDFREHTRSSYKSVIKRQMIPKDSKGLKETSEKRYANDQEAHETSLVSREM
jgi:hypothetical protein